MNDRYVTEKLLEDFSSQLRAAGCAQGTAENYLRHVRAFARWLEGGEATGEAAAGWRCWLLEQGYGPPSVNGMLVALNRFFKFAGWDCRAELLRIQRRAFRDRGRELARGEYERLVKAARAGDGDHLCHRHPRQRAAICHRRGGQAGTGRDRPQGQDTHHTDTGPAAAQAPGLRKKNKTASGEIFLTRSGRSLGRKQIWAEMKAACRSAHVAPGKVFPHNLRHLFARVFYRECPDIVKLADVLGHSSIDTARIYLVASGEEHARVLDRLRLVT